jgi:hypothetical protein
MYFNNGRTATMQEFLNDEGNQELFGALQVRDFINSESFAEAVLGNFVDYNGETDIGFEKTVTEEIAEYFEENILDTVRDMMLEAINPMIEKYGMY